METKGIIDKIEPEAPKKVRCDFCLKELPGEEALTHEVEDYAFWFCGQECYAKWHNEHEKKGNH